MDIIRIENMDGIILYVLKKNDTYHFATTIGKEEILDDIAPNYSIDFKDINNEFHTDFLNSDMFENAIKSIPFDQFQDMMVFMASMKNYTLSYFNNYLQVIMQEAFARVYKYKINKYEDLILRYTNFQLVFTLDTENVLIITCGELHPSDDSITEIRIFAFREPYVNELFKSQKLNFDFMLNHVDYKNLTKKIASYYYHKIFNNNAQLNINKDIRAYKRIQKINLLLNA